MEQDRQELLAHSLTGESADIVPHLPYLLQDFWELGSDPQEILELLQPHLPPAGDLTVLDLACGKGAVAIALAKELDSRVKGVDLLTEFIREAQEKAREHGVDHLCTFAVEDVAQTVEREQNRDLVVWGAAGGQLLGGYGPTLEKLGRVLGPGGLLIIDDAYVRAEEDNDRLRYQGCYPTWAQWLEHIDRSGFRVVASRVCEERDRAEGDAEELEWIIRRAEELIALHPGQEALLRHYIANQEAEYRDLEDLAVGVLWLLQRAD